MNIAAEFIDSCCYTAALYITSSCNTHGKIPGNVPGKFPGTFPKGYSIHQEATSSFHYYAVSALVIHTGFTIAVYTSVVHLSKVKLEWGELATEPPFMLWSMLLGYAMKLPIAVYISGFLREETHSNSGYTTNPTNHQKCY